MPWQECSTMSLRQEFLALAENEGVNFSELCRRFGISRKTGYKWRRRYREKGVTGLADRSRRPQHSPRRSSPDIEEKVLAVRDEYGWGARKIKSCLERAGEGPLAKSTVHAILLRHKVVTHSLKETVGSYRRFERNARTNSGRWTLRDTFIWELMSSVIRSRCSMIIRVTRFVSRPVAMRRLQRCSSD